MSIEKLAERQNPDGGWPYTRGRSWTEPTVYAILALEALGEEARAEKGLHWVRAAQRADGGWPPQGSVDESTWVTALAALLPRERLGAAIHERAVRWLATTSGRESGTLYRLRERLLGRPTPPEMEHAGWPWVPGAAAWVGPTSLAILALEKEQRRQPSAQIRQRIQEGRRFLAARMCRGGGWNHGSVRALGYESLPYPETTGMALAALRGVASPEVDRALAVAGEFLAQCRSADALNWLRLGLRAHGRLPEGYRPPPEVRYRTCPELSLQLLAGGPEKAAGLLWN